MPVGTVDPPPSRPSQPNSWAPASQRSPPTRVVTRRPARSAIDASTAAASGRSMCVVVAVRAGFDYRNAVRQGARLRVATKYVQTAREHFAAKGVHVDLIKLYGSMELAPLVGLADAIVDLVSTGSTLKANGLCAVEEIALVSARLIVNQAALKLKREAVQPLLDAFARAVA